MIKTCLMLMLRLQRDFFYKKNNLKSLLSEAQQNRKIDQHRHYPLLIYDFKIFPANLNISHKSILVQYMVRSD